MTTTPTLRYTARDIVDALQRDTPAEKRQYPTSEQQAVIESGLDPMLVVAGAGSGKTATMADRVVWLVANGIVRPDEILGVTFTRKAAGELRERITRKLEQLLEAELISPEDVMPAEVATAVEHADISELLAPSVSTYHSYANTLVSEYGLQIGLEPETQLIGEAKAWQLVHQLVSAYDRADVLVESDQSAGSLAGYVMRLAGDCAEHLQTPEDVEAHLNAELSRVEAWQEAGTNPSSEQAKLIRTLRVRREMTELVRRYQRRKLTEGLMDYGDLLRFAAQIALEVPSAGEAEREKYKVVLLDEFQDTSYAQLALFSSLYGAGGSAGGLGHAVTAVGDPNQSIYGFRGASAGQLFDFPQSFPALDADTSVRRPADLLQLTVAWRNGERILDVANRLVTPFQPDTADSQDKPWRQHNAHLRAQLKPLSPPEGAHTATVRYGWYTSEVEESLAITEQLAAVLEPDSQGEVPSCAVLARTRAQLETIAEHLRVAGLDYELVGLSGLLSTPEVAEVLAYLRVISDPGRSDALIRILGGARYRIGPRDLMRLQQSARDLEGLRKRSPSPAEPDNTPSPDEPQRETSTETDAEDRHESTELEMDERASLVEALERLKDAPEQAEQLGLSAEGHRRLLLARDQIRRLRQWATLDLGVLIQRIVSDTGLDIEVAARPWEEQHYAARQLDALIDQAESYAATETTPDLRSFLDWLDAAEEKERGLEQADIEPTLGAIQLLTIHASKGLEWDVVVVAGLREEKFPSKKADRWTGSNGMLPAPLRGDRRSIPQWESEQPDMRSWAVAAGVGAWKPFTEENRVYTQDVQDFSREEERRLAYVAVTRARALLLCTGACFYGTTAGKEPSEFLLEIREIADGFGDASAALEWAEIPDMKDNPVGNDLFGAQWPYDPLAPLPIGRYRKKAAPEGEVRLPEMMAVEAPQNRPGRREALTRAAELVEQALAERSTASGEEVLPLTPWEQEAAWVVDRARTQQRGTGKPRFPGHISVSGVVGMARNAESMAEFARRPVPVKPSQAARRGTVMHEWIEEFYETRSRLPGIEEPNRGDEDLDDAFDLATVKARFTQTEWAQRRLYAAEIPVETTLDGVVIRGRIDAIFGKDDAGRDLTAEDFERWELKPAAERNAQMQQCTWGLVDWKTGMVPTGKDLREKQIQLAVYRLAFHRLYGVPLEQIEASFFYVEHGETVPGVDLPEEDALQEYIRGARDYFS
ncbi:ATP-dependent DNA helicase [Nesterenkonia halotolerans]|uniref:DNA 3'-5' helicase n=1 Tax=Nesterenkonia halotolerans TaxID=225325 RepID=A0ABR9J5P8_9MICC|nr:ATP-dependent DNA helicase [Nesterenkonia halotolerans]MBE1514327.1 DNA helicase-2/ATP-dependent DNA helicase PcrA [Nesterenkonia halotolerans]